MRKFSCSLLLILMGALSVPVHADVDTAKAFAKKYAAIAKTINPDFKGFLPDMGRNFFKREFTLKGKQVSCSSCHTDDPAKTGKHIVNGKPIKPLSPVVEKTRFTDLEKVEKNFVSHCNDILGRDCTAQEKGDYIAYLLTIKFDPKGAEQPASK